MQTLRGGLGNGKPLFTLPGRPTPPRPAPAKPRWEPVPARDFDDAAAAEAAALRLFRQLTPTPRRRA